MKKISAFLILAVFIFSGCSLFKKPPQEAVNEGMMKFAEVQKMQSAMTIKGTIQNPTGEAPSRISFTADIGGKSDVSDSKDVRFETTIKVDLGVDDKSGNGEIQIRGIGGKFFVKLNSLKLPTVSDVTPPDLSSLFSVWWEIPTGENSPLKTLPEEQQKLKEKLKTINLFTSATEEGEEDVRGETSIKYRVELDRAALKNLIVDLARTSKNTLAPAEEEGITEALNDLDFSGVVSINGDDILNHVRGTLASQPKVGAASSFDIDYTAWGYGDDVEIVVPEGAKEFNPLMLFALMGQLGSIQSGTSTQGIPADAGE